MASPLTRALLRKCDHVSGLMRSLAHPVRLKVLCQLADGEKSVGALTDFCDIDQPAMSQFLGRMKKEGLVTARREGTSIYYRIADERLIHVLQAVREAYC